MIPYVRRAYSGHGMYHYIHSKLDFSPKSSHHDLEFPDGTNREKDGKISFQCSFHNKHRNAKWKHKHLLNNYHWNQTQNMAT